MFKSLKCLIIVPFYSHGRERLVLVVARCTRPSGVQQELNCHSHDQRWSRGHKARGQGQGQGHKKNPRPRPRPRTAFPRTDALEAKDRNARGQGQGPRTQSASALQKKKVFTKIFQAISKKKKKKKVFTKIFQAISTKKRFPDNFSSAPQNFNIPKNSAVLEPRTGQFSRT